MYLPVVKGIPLKNKNFKILTIFQTPSYWILFFYNILPLFSVEGSGSGKGMMQLALDLTLEKSPVSLATNFSWMSEMSAGGSLFTFVLKTSLGDFLFSFVWLLVISCLIQMLIGDVKLYLFTDKNVLLFDQINIFTDL